MLKQQPISLKIKKKGKLISQENHYDKIKLIGEGTFGKVFLAKNKKDNKIYAIKEVLQDPRYKNRQLGIISRIDHENIIFMIDYYIKIVNEDYYLNIVMDFMPTSLNLIIKEKRKNKQTILPEHRKIFIFQMFKGLYYMQLNNICHRDLKPPNILINDQTLQLKICDFGSAKILQKKQKNVSYICSRYYRAPQLILGSSSYGTQIDVWSAGCIIVQFLTLQPIFPGDSSIQQLIQITKILGTPPQKLIRIYEQINMTSLPFPKIKANSWAKILKKYNPQPQLIDLIEKVLNFDTQKRLKPHQVLLHPYFHDIIKMENLTKKIPHLFSFDSLNNKKNKRQIQLLQRHYNPKFHLKKQELILKNSNNKPSLQLVSKQQTQPSSTSPADYNGQSAQVSLHSDHLKTKNIQIKSKKQYFIESKQKSSNKQKLNDAEQNQNEEVQKQQIQNKQDQNIQFFQNIQNQIDQGKN